MLSLRQAEASYQEVPQSAVQRQTMRQLYEDLLSAPQQSVVEARTFLVERLQQVGDFACDLPASANDLAAWSASRTNKVTDEYSSYLQLRKQGAKRLYFSNRAHALYFLRAVAPTKLVDGAWLYGLMPHWRDPRLQTLIQTFLEELGDGVPAQNHALMYRKLLIGLGCDDLSSLEDALYEQGALQLALGHLAAQYLPEAIGFNLGYEQLPLHLLITAYELEELGIDPYYFKLHVTIDNTATGHARKAVQAVMDNMPKVADADEFYRRVVLGYRLNDIGVGSTAVIASFDIEREVLKMLEQKRLFAGNVHSDYCRLEGRTVNEWLSAPESIRHFLHALQRRGWIRRNSDPQQSRFWQLVHGQQAAMFGVFTEYEQQLLHDWIAGDWLAHQENSLASKKRATALKLVTGAKPAIDDFVNEGNRVRVPDLDADAQALDQELRRLNADQQEQRLVELAGPAVHWSAAGLKATRILVDLVR